MIFNLSEYVAGLLVAGLLVTGVGVDEFGGIESESAPVVNTICFFILRAFAVYQHIFPVSNNNSLSVVQYASSKSGIVQRLLKKKLYMSNFCTAASTPVKRHLFPKSKTNQAKS